MVVAVDAGIEIEASEVVARRWVADDIRRAGPITARLLLFFELYCSSHFSFIYAKLCNCL